jgi:hypothetical protein
MKQLGLFGDEAMMPQVKRTKAEVFEDYDAFVAKFDKNAPKTTDDCYTPQPVYEAVVNWVKERVDLEGRCILRPFYPGGDYEREEYPENCVRYKLFCMWDKIPIFFDGKTAQTDCNDKRFSICKR